MTNGYARAAGVVVGVALAAAIFYGSVLGVERGGGPALPGWPVVEGVLIGAAALAAWNLVVTREAAVLGLGVAALLVVGGAADFGFGLRFAHEPMGWATVLALLARLAAPEPAGAAGRPAEAAESQPVT